MSNYSRQDGKWYVSFNKVLYLVEWEQESMEAAYQLGIQEGLKQGKLEVNSDK